MAGWRRVVGELRAQVEAARTAARRLESVDSGLRSAAAGVLFGVEVDVLRGATALLRAHLGDQPPPRRLPVAAVWPLRPVWLDQVVDRLRGVWQAVPGQDVLEQARRVGSGELGAVVAEQGEALRRSLHGQWRQSRSLRGASGGIGGCPEPREEYEQLAARLTGAHEQVVAFAEAVLALLVDRRAGGVLPPAARTVRGAGRWIGREERIGGDHVLAPLLPFPSVVTLIGLWLLLMVCAVVPVTFMLRAGVYDSHGYLLYLAGPPYVAVGSIGISWLGPRLTRAAGARAAIPGVVAVVVAVAVGVLHVRVADYVWAGS